MKKLAFILIVLVLFLAAQKGTVYAASLSQFSDTITTSRPSAATPLGADQGAAAAFADIISDTQNYSIFIASDSASIFADPNGGSETTNTGLNVASMSALNIPTSGHRIVYFTNTITNAHHQGDVIVVPITAMHTITFKPQTSIPSGGKIIISFPGTGINTASPSAQTFSFNGMASGTTDISYQLAGGATCTSLTVSAPTITCTTTGGTIPGGSTLTFLIGCGDANTNESTCASPKPRLINPTKATSNTQSGASAATTLSDNWKINVQTQDASNVTLDNSTTTIGTIESVQVQASVDPTLTFTITGIASGTNLSSGHGASCADTTNSGITTTASFVNLGILTSTKINIAAQDLSVATNEAAGYALTATSSGHLMNAGSGYAIADPGGSAIPMVVGTENFGLHACGTDANAAFVPASGLCTSSACTAGGSGKIEWPAIATPLSIASRGTITSGIVTTVEYASTVSGTTPAGIYNTVITYVATPTFN